MSAKNHPIAKHFIIVAADGDPIKSAFLILENDTEGRFDRLVLLIGQFHAFMEVFKKANLIFEDSINYLIAPFYAKGEDKEATDRNLSYFLNFNDPTVPERHLGVIIMAINLIVLMEMQLSGIKLVSTESMGEYMRERAKTSPQDCMLLNLLEYFTMVVLLRKAERRNKFNLYLACMRLSLPLLAVANAKNYVHIFTDFLKYWATALDAKKELVQKYGFTLETANGVTVALDYGHEKYVRLVRDSTGKIF